MAKTVNVRLVGLERRCEDSSSKRTSIAETTDGRTIWARVPLEFWSDFVGIPRILHVNANGPSCCGLARNRGDWLTVFVQRGEGCSFSGASKVVCSAAWDADNQAAACSDSTCGGEYP